ncbi:DUF3068 domain-containing protein [Tsukamurella sp. 1534]|uniref:DUF3068 domain-containing protein n=1 Tax=Tsukamurella sp. 1534 TaxID=1151061 RepID=UPI00030C7E4A|nr:DUF3068 domain-containing protein [Tsukamurella sp. 1534]
MAVGRSRLARVIGPILIFLGALLITSAIASPIYVADKLKTIPLDLDVTTIAKSAKPADSDADAEFPAKQLDLCSFNKPRAQVNEVAVTTQSRTLVTAPSDKSSMTVQSGTSMVVPSIKTKGDPRHPELTGANKNERPCDDGLVQAWVDRVSLDRESGAPNGKTSEATFSPGESAPAVKLGDRKGLQYRFPAGTEKEGKYEFFDLITRSNMPLEFVEEKEVSGTNTLHFRGKRDWVDLSTIRDGNDPTLGTVLTKTAGWWGIDDVDPKDDITLNRWAKTDVDLYVDPKSGIIVDQSQHFSQEFRLPGQVAPNTPRAVRDFRLNVFDAQQKWDDATVRSQAEDAKSQQNKIAVAKYVVPIAGGLLGLIALGLGVFALLVSRGAVPAGPGFGRGKRKSDAAEGSLDDAPTVPTESGEDEPATEAFSAQPRPDDSQTEAIDFRDRDQRDQR